jgi:hypothetical protein
MTKTNNRQLAAAAKRMKCAIYTRKSTEDGLEQEFNSLDAQRESGEAYIKSQAHEGWDCVPDQYDDGGFTGGNMDRPALRRLIADIEAGKVDCVVVYKVDRLSRSLLDFARMLEIFERHRVAFVSVNRTLTDVSPAEGIVPILYLPGVDRQQLRAASDCPEPWQPLVELQYRGTVWTQRNGRDWTVEAFLTSDNALGLDVSLDLATRQAIQRALPLSAWSQN